MLQLAHIKSKSAPALALLGLVAGSLAVSGASALRSRLGAGGAEMSAVQGARGEVEVLRYRVTGPDNYSASDVRSIQDWVVAQTLNAVPGVAQVQSQGGGKASRLMASRAGEPAEVTGTVTMEGRAQRQDVQAGVEAALRRINRNGSLPRGFQLTLLQN